MKLVIIAGGLATRLRPITEKIPKALVPIKGKPAVQWLVEKARSCGVTEIIFCIGHLGEQIEAYFGDGSGWGVKISYSREHEQVGTGGALKLAEKLVGKHQFLMAYGDLLIEMNLKKLIEFHKKSSALATLTLKVTDHPYDSDMIEVDENGRVVAWLGKAVRGEPVRGYGNAGVYCFEPSVFKLIPEGKSALDKDVLPVALKKGFGIYGYITSEIIRDIGTHDRYEKHK